MLPVWFTIITSRFTRAKSMAQASIMQLHYITVYSVVYTVHDVIVFFIGAFLCSIKQSLYSVKCTQVFTAYRLRLYYDAKRSGARFSKNLRKNPKFSVSFS